ncbi:MAG TPA: exosortase-associated EpsI family protein [Gemmataceae bacterium]|nr:exosortase-associated EpsI family protein [Gemmataceae bacterium]
MKFLPLCVAVAVLGVAGWVHGVWTGRWSQSATLEAAVARMKLPEELGDWKGQPQELDERSQYVGGINGYASWEYTNKATNERLSVLLLCGRPGAVAVHTPDICYRAAGYQLIGSATPTTIKWVGREAEFQKITMSRDNITGKSSLQAFWSWTTTGDWQTPGSPRMTFAREPFLYKLYVIRDMDSQPAWAGDDGAKGFIHDLLPVLQATLFRPSDTGTPVAKR